MSTTPASVDPARAAENNIGWILGITGTFHTVAVLFVGLRVYTRLFQVRQFGIDDALIIISVLCASGGGMATYIVASFYGLGRHADTVPKAEYTIYLKMTFIQAVASTIGSLAFLKLSIGAALMRLSNQKWYRRIIWSFIGFVVLYSIISWTEWFLVCKPLAGFWDKSIKADCIPQNIHKGFALFNTTSNIITDIAFATLPVPVIWQLQMKKRLRIYLVLILSLGYFAVLLGIVKTICQNVFRGDPDQSFYNWIQFWGFLQINVGIIAACAPTLRRIFSSILGLKSSYYADPTYPAGTPGHGSNRYASRRSHIGGGGGGGGLGGLTSRGPNGGGWMKAQSQNDDVELLEVADTFHEASSVGGGSKGTIRHSAHLATIVGGDNSSEEVILKEGPGAGKVAHHQHHRSEDVPHNRIVKTTVVTVS